MNHLDIRNQFIQFFEDNQHTLVPPSSIVPHDDPTLLFTNAGMNQFKDVLLGKEKRSYSRAISVQPCMRVGGKHNDLDEVGRDGRHLTWFEMLGNWSFGDYGKEQAIYYAWQFVTKTLQMDTSKIYASIYKNDDESYGYWKKIAGLPDSQIVRLGDIEQGDEENFWSMGPTGPCGRCTELYFDQGEKLFGHDVVGGETDRYLEFWNLVFMEFNRDEQGKFTDLPMLSVDTGMGMERIAALLEGKTNVFETSLFMPFIEEVAQRSGRNPIGEDLIAMRVLADHSRGLTFALNDNAQFDRAGRGYVLRRILRRAVLHGTKLGFKEPFLHQLVATNIKNLPVYAIDAAQQQKITQTIKAEEEKFFETLDRGLAFFAKAAEEAREKTIAGNAAFQLHDTYGFPIDLTMIIAEEKGLKVDKAGFEAALEEQRGRSQAASQFYDKGGWIVVQEGEAKPFAEYGITEQTASLLQYRASGAENTFDMMFDATPLYVEGGGELADYGYITQGSMVFKVEGVVRSPLGVVHTAVLQQGDISQLKEQEPFVIQADIQRRAAKSAHHTATHLLHAALRSVLGESVRQMGSMVDENRLRFDISFDRALTATEIAAVESLVNRWIVEAHPVEHLADVPFKQAEAMGALAFFGDKYGETVRVIAIPQVSVELCGGNHVINTGQIGSLLVVNQEALGAGVRRIEAVCHLAAIQYSAQIRETVQTLAEKLSCPLAQVAGRVEKLQEDLKTAHQRYQKALKSSVKTVDAATLLAQKTVKEDIVIVVADLAETPVDVAKKLIDDLRQAESNGVFALITKDLEEDKGMVFLGAGDAAVASGKHAGNLAKEIGKQLGSGGGGRPTFAQTGFKAQSAEAVLKAVKSVF